MQKEDRRQTAESLPAQTQGRLDLMASIEEIVEAAANKKPEDKRSKAAQTRDIRGSRTKKRASLRPREAFDLGPNKDRSADTSQDVARRVADAKNDPTFLLAPLEIVATYSLRNLPRSRVENLLHRFFAAARPAELHVTDRFGKKTSPKEWFYVLPEHVG